jgi:hypothetical protein
MPEPRSLPRRSGTHESTAPEYLIEHLGRRLIERRHLRADISQHGKSTFDRWTGANGCDPIHEPRIGLLHRLVEIRADVAYPGEGGDIGNGVVRPAKVRRRCQSSFEDVEGSAAEAMLIAVAKVSAALLEAEIDAMPCVTVHDELVVEAAEDVADQAVAILERGMREGFEQVFGHLPNYDDVARFVVGSVERRPTWGGKRFDPQALSEGDREILFKGLDEIAAVFTAGSEEDDDDEEELEIVLPQATSAAPDALAARADDGLDIPDFLRRVC